MRTPRKRAQEGGFGFGEFAGGAEGADAGFGGTRIFQRSAMRWPFSSW